jgi:ketosteroid isomerase-like protein
MAMEVATFPAERRHGGSALSGGAHFCSCADPPLSREILGGRCCRKTWRSSGRSWSPLLASNVAEVDWGTQALGEMLGRAYSPDIELRTLEIPLGLDISDRYHGLDGLVEYLRAWLEPFGGYHVENLDYIEAGDCVLVPSRQWGVGRGSGTRTEIQLTALYELRDGKIARIHQFDTLDEALEAAGLRE